HLRNRILHAGGDATGAEVSRALLAAVSNDPGIEVVEHALVLDALKTKAGRVCGVTIHVIGEGTRDGVGQVLARAVVLATGGLGQVYSQTTNPSVSTGDGVALALRAGADVADVEFIQFHPTVLYMGEGSRGQQPLISEAVRGEGAFLVNDRGERFMRGVHPLADLAPRDIVAKEISRQMQLTGSHHVWLDARSIKDFSERFPTIKIRGELQRAMSKGASVVRSKESLQETLTTLAKLKNASTIFANLDAWETTNLYLLATAIVRSALERTESRGSHWREDFPETSSEWTKRIHQSLSKNGDWKSATEEVFNDLSIAR
ncbi:MAG: FAD-binding protein, partial [Actinobacteria bacterium]|nr:FAD-binding protein [Actinomycetota bacterium]